MKLKNNSKWLENIILLTLFLTSTFLKLTKLNNVEYKYDQQFSFNVLQNCKVEKLLGGNLDFLFISSSSGIPQGPLHYKIECISGLMGVSSYINFLQIKIIASQIILVFVYRIIKNNVSKNVALSVITFLFLNPYLIISSRNISSVYNHEFFMIIFLILFINRKKSRSFSFFYGLISSLSFAIYFPYIIYSSVLNLVFVLKDRFKNFNSIVIGYLFGVVINIILYFPVKDLLTLSSLNESKSWGLSSYWRLMLQFMSGSSLQNKINSSFDKNLLNYEFPLNEWFYQINNTLIIGLMIFGIFKLFINLYKNVLDDFDVAFLSIVIISGLLFTLLDRTLYPHYYFFTTVFLYVFISKSIKNSLSLALITFTFAISSIFIVTNFHSYIEQYNGASTSDYGKHYNSCGSFEDDARVCRGQ